MAGDKQHIVFFHPDLGIGGAERLVVDAAVGLQDRGHKVTIFTSHCDPRHCFDEARDGKLPLPTALTAYPPFIHETRQLRPDPGAKELSMCEYAETPLSQAQSLAALLYSVPYCGRCT